MPHLTWRLLDVSIYTSKIYSIPFALLIEEKNEINTTTLIYNGSGYGLTDFEEGELDSLDSAKDF